MYVTRRKPNHIDYSTFLLFFIFRTEYPSYIIMPKLKVGNKSTDKEVTDDIVQPQPQREIVIQKINR